MDEDTKTCENCKRDIPAANYLTHSMYCARNIGVCPVCKEPVPHAQRDQHHQKMHKLAPCKQCGEGVCGTDLEDHIRDSCGHTIKKCRFCELELPRREQPAHEGYCGVRTELCAECGEWVMIKYRQLHLDSNHGFLRLNDDPAPQPRRANRPKNSNIPKPSNVASTSNGGPSNVNNISNNSISNRTLIRYFNEALNSGSGSEGNEANGDVMMKRTNDQPQINTAVVATNKVNKDLPSGSGAVKKRTAPKPPASAPPPNPARDQPYYSAMQRRQEEDTRREVQNAYNMAMGLPIVLDPAAKQEKLRKMSALFNGAADECERAPRRLARALAQAQAQEPMSVAELAVQMLTREDEEEEAFLRRALDFPPASPPENGERQRTGPRPADRPQDTDRPTTARQDPASDRPDSDDCAVFRDLKPMNPEEFMRRLTQFDQNDVYVTGDGETATDNDPERDNRFNTIKASLKELRRGLNEVTAPLNDTNSDARRNYSFGGRVPRATGPRPRPRPPAPPTEDLLELPCEFCEAPIPAELLVEHQTGCRPDLARLLTPPPASPRSPPRSPARSPPPRPGPGAGEVVIPCEFCAHSIPVHLLTEHQRRRRSVITLDEAARQSRSLPSL